MGTLVLACLSPLPSASRSSTSGNGEYGIFVAEPPFGAVSQVTNNNNRSLANGMFDLFDRVPGCSGQVWSGNTFFSANQSIH
jgi:hypothetical protein